MKPLLFLALLTLSCAPCRSKAQALAATADAKPSSFSAQYAFDPLQKGKPVQVVSYTAKTFDDVFDRKGLSVDARILVGVQTNLTLGTALTHTFSFVVPLARGYRPKIDLSVGPWLNYGLGEKRLRGGLYLGVGGSF